MQSSIWEKETFYAPKDIIIVGSGLVGLWCAYYLKKKSPRLTIAIIDRGIIPTGASTRNAGFACFGSVTELLDDINKMGEDKMLELVAMRYKGMKRIEALLSRRDIDFNWCGGYELITEKNNRPKEELEEQVDMVNGLLMSVVRTKGLFRLADSKINKFGFKHVAHLLENKLEGQLHSGKLCRELLRWVHSMGVVVLNGVEVTGLEKNGAQITIRTNQLPELKATNVLICTNAFAKQLLPEVDVVPARGQVLLTSPIDKLPFKGCFHYDEGFYYFRNLGDRVLLGGARNRAFEEETTVEMQTTDKIQDDLEYFLSRYLLPGKKYTVTDRWSGIMGMGSEKMPVVKELSPGVFCAVRMSGMGVALSPVIGELVAKMLTH